MKSDDLADDLNEVKPVKSDEGINPSALVRGGTSLKPKRAIPRLVGNFLAKGKLSILGGVGGVSKSTLTIHLGNCIASGRPFMGMPIHEPCKPLLLCLEDSQDDVDRMYRADIEQHEYRESEFQHGNMDRRPIILGMDTVKRVLNISAFQALRLENGNAQIDPDLIRKMRLLVSAENIGFMSIDPLASLYGGATVDNAASNALARCLAELAMEQQISIAALSHLTKASHTQKQGTQSIKFGGEITDTSRSTAIVQSADGNEMNDLSCINDAEDVKTAVKFTVTKSNMGRTGETFFYSVKVRGVYCTEDERDEQVQVVKKLDRPVKSDLFNPFVWDALLPYFETDEEILRGNRGASDKMKIEKLVQDVVDELGDELPVKPDIKPFVRNLIKDGRLEEYEGKRNAKLVRIGPAGKGT